MIQEFWVRNAMHAGISVVGWKRAFWRQLAGVLVTLVMAPPLRQEGEG